MLQIRIIKQEDNISDLKKAFAILSQRQSKIFQYRPLNATGCCLPEYVGVLQPDGTQIPIDLIRPTHKVLSYNLSKNLIEPKKVTKVFKKPLGARRIYRITHQFGFLECTEDHRIYTINAGYIRASIFSNQNKVVFIPSSKGYFDVIEATESLKASACIRKIRTFKDEPTMPVYDIEVEDNHNFFAERILVRN